MCHDKFWMEQVVKKRFWTGWMMERVGLQIGMD
jgi:hypothetical protein